MAGGQHIDDILSDWEYDPDGLCARLVQGADDRELLQVRVDMGILQLETTGRPDGERPQGYETYYDYLVAELVRKDDKWAMDDEQCSEADREFIQFYHRRVSWLKLNRFDQAIEDANHTLGLMDFCRKYSPDEHWTISHEQYRPFVMFHRIQAEALRALDEESAEKAVHAINGGLAQLRELFEEHEASEYFEDDELVTRLTDMRESLRNKYEVGQTLQEQLAAAVAQEEYELAARLRDELAQRTAN